jgi:phage-related tail fiber protein
MALVISTEYTNANPPDAAYPQGSFKNSDTPTSRNGTPLEKAWPNDIYGFLQALLHGAGIVPSGNPDTAVASDYLTAMQALFASAAQGALADTALQPGEALIIGEVREFAFQAVPPKWLELGQAVSRTTYAALFAKIGTTWGPGNGTTTFDLPPRGYFIRSWDNGAGVDPGRTFGSIQEDQSKHINRFETAADSTHTVGSATIPEDGSWSTPKDTGRSTDGNDVSIRFQMDDVETHPANIAMLVCIYAGV